MLRAHHNGFDPRDLAAAGVGPVATAADLAAARAGPLRGTGRRRRARLHRRPVPGDPHRAVARARRLARGARPACSTRPRRSPGSAAAATSPRTTSRRSPGRRCGTGSGCATRPSSRASPPTPSWTRCSPPSRRPGSADDHLAGAGPARWRSARRPSPCARRCRTSPWLPLGCRARRGRCCWSLSDWLIAAPAGEVTLRRTGPDQVRLGDSATVDAHRHQRLGPHACARWSATPGCRRPARPDPYAHARRPRPGRHGHDRDRR